MNLLIYYFVNISSNEIVLKEKSEFAKEHLPILLMNNLLQGKTKLIIRSKFIKLLREVNNHK